MGNSENPLGTNIIDNLTSPKYFQIATAIKKYWWLASYPFYLFLERNELLEVPFIKMLWNMNSKRQAYPTKEKNNTS